MKLHPLERPHRGSSGRRRSNHGVRAWSLPDTAKEKPQQGEVLAAGPRSPQ